MKEIISIERKGVINHKEQSWVEFKVHYNHNGGTGLCWVPVISSVLKELKGKSLEEHITQIINKPR